MSVQHDRVGFNGTHPLAIDSYEPARQRRPLRVQLGNPAKSRRDRAVDQCQPQPGAEVLPWALALDSGVTRDEIQEVLLRCVAYCGTLVGVDAFPVAEEVFSERDRRSA